MDFEDRLCGSRKCPYPPPPPMEGIFALDPPTTPGISIPGGAWNTPHTSRISVIFQLDWVHFKKNNKRMVKEETGVEISGG